MKHEKIIEFLNFKAGHEKYLEYIYKSFEDLQQKKSCSKCGNAINLVEFVQTSRFLDLLYENSFFYINGKFECLNCTQCIIEDDKFSNESESLEFRMLVSFENTIEYMKLLFGIYLNSAKKLEAMRTLALSAKTFGLKIPKPIMKMIFSFTRKK